MKSENKIIIIISLIFITLFSMTIVSASDYNNESTSVIDEDSLVKVQEHVSMDDKSLYKNDVTNLKNSNNYVYVDANGNSSSDGSDSNNPTTIYHAISSVENEGTILLTGNDNVTYYNITDNINIKNLNSDVYTFTITASENTNIVLQFYSTNTLNVNGNYHIKISNLSFTRNYESKYPVIISNASMLTIDNCSIYNVANSYRYGAISNSKSMNISNSRFYNNSASRQGGVIYSENGQVTIDNCIFENNKAENGAVLSSLTSKTYIYNSTFRNNHASYGGVYSIRDDSELVIENSSFVNNSAEYNGAVLDSWYSTSNTNNSMFINNSAEYGGVVYSAHNLKTKILNSLFEYNNANLCGNNVYSYNDDLTVYNSVLTYNDNSKSIYCFNTTYNLNNNWWGVNNPNFRVITNDLLPTNWRLMNITLNNETSYYKLNVSLNQLSNLKTTDEELHNRIISFESNNGSFLFEKANITKKITNEYTGNVNDIIVKIDNQSMTLSDKIVPYISVEDITAKINDNITITVKCNPGLTDNITLDIAGKVFTNLTLVNGVCLYNYFINSTWNTGIYNIKVSLTGNPIFNDTSVYSTLTINDNHNISVTLVSNSNNNYVEDDVEIPSRYDLSSTLEYQTSVKDQGNSGSCWAFSTLATLESAYKKDYGIEYDFSENNMKNILKKYSIIGDMSDYPDGGNNELEPLSYLIGWYGPVLEEDDPYDDYSLMSPVINNTVKVEDVYFYYRDSYTGKDNNALKEAIMKYGALTSAVYSDSSSTNWYVDYSNVANHAISIVGWDDYYSKYYFKNSYKIENDGAYIIKNSWGSDSGKDGYFYVSYYDTSLAGVDFNSIWGSYSYTFPLKTYENYTNLYQHDTVSNRVETLTPSAWVRNVYTAKNNESIAGIGTFIYEDTDYEAYVYVNDKLCYSQNGTFLQEGYRIIKLDNYVAVHEGDTFKVDLKLQAHVGEYTTITLQNANLYKSISKANQSFISTDGENWEDLYTSSNYKYSAACLKVYTKQTPIISSNINQTEYYDISTEVTKLTSSGRLSYKIDDEYYTDNNGDIVYVEVNENGTYNISIPTRDIKEYEYNITVILESEDYNVTENITMITPVNVIITTRNVTCYVDEEEAINVTIEIQDNIYNKTLNEGNVILINYNTIKYKSDVVNGTAKIVLDEYSGNYTYLLKYRGSQAYTANSVYANISIIKHDLNIEIVNITNSYYNQNAVIIARVSYVDNDKAVSGITVFAKVDGKSYNVRTNKTGYFSITHKINSTGEHNLTAYIYEDTKYHAINYNHTFNSYKTDTNITVTIGESYIEENTIITGKLVDKSNNVIKNTNLSLYLDEKSITNVTTDSKGVFTTNLTINSTGESILKVVYNGDDNYNNMTTTTTITTRLITTNITINKINNVNINESVTITGRLTTAHNENVSNSPLKIIINQIEYTVTTDSSGIFTFSNKTNIVGLNNVSIIFEGEYPYNGTTAQITFNVTKIDTEITITHPSNTTYNNTITIRGTLKDKNNNTIKNNQIELNINGKTFYNYTDNSGLFNINITSNITGINNITISYAGNEYYESISATTTYFVSKKSTKITLDNIPTTTVNSDITIKGKLTDNDNNPLQETISIEINNNTITTTTEYNGEYQHTIKLDTIGTNNITITFNENNNYQESTTTSTFNVIKQNTKITINSIPSTKYKNTITITGTLTDTNNNPLKNSNITLQINNEKYNTTTDENGQYTNPYTTNTIGTNNITITYDGNNSYQNSMKTTTFQVIKQNTKITVNNVENKIIGENVTIEGILTYGDDNPLNNTKIILKINNDEYNITTNNNGKYTYTINTNTTGTNNITITYFGDNNYLSNYTQTSFNVNKITTTLSVNQISDLKYNDNLTITVRLTDQYNNKIPNTEINIKINNEEKTILTDNNGEYQHTIKLDTIGTNNITITFNGNYKYIESNTTTTFTVSQRNSKLTINRIKDAYTVDTITITGTLTDDQANKIQNTWIQVTINTKTVSVKTDTTGTYILTTKQTTPGIQNVTVTYTGNKYYTMTSIKSSFILKIKQTKITINPIKSVAYGNIINITGKLTTSDNEAIQSSLNVNINGKTLNVKTNSAGIFTITTKTSKPINGTIVITYNSNNYYNNSNASAEYEVTARKTYISINNISSIAYGGTLNITGTFCDEFGNLFKNTALQGTLNGKSFNLKTNAEGVFTITTKTSKPSTNNITVSFKGNNNYLATSSSTTFNVTARNTTFKINTIGSVVYGQTLNITGVFQDEYGNLFKNTAVQGTLNGKTFTVKTDAYGVFTITTKISTVGSNTITMSFKGNTNYLASSTTTTFTSTKAQTKININTIGNVKKGTNITITGTFKDQNNNNIVNSALKGNLNGNTFTVKTNNKGVFTITTRANTVGTNNITITYPGSTYYQSSNKTATFKVST